MPDPAFVAESAFLYRLAAAPSAALPKLSLEPNTTMQLIRNRIVRATFVIFTFWWVVLTAYQAFTTHIDINTAVQNFKLSMLNALIGVVAGSAYAAIRLYRQRAARLKRLKGSVLRGMQISIGQVPVFRPPPPYVEPTSLPYPPEVPAGFFETWISATKKTHPHHAALAQRLLGIYEAHKHYPATHHVGGHGGRTLFEHTLLVAWQCHEQLKTWKYKGLIANKGKVMIPPHNPTFVIDPNDPLFVVAGLAHDLGKIECYRWENGKVVDSDSVHDSISARMLSRLDEYWELPQPERSALNSAVGCYHKPDRISLRPDRTLDDRSVSLMELLIRADNHAGRVEMGTAQVDGDSDDELTQPIPQSQQERIWTGFFDVVNGAGQINNEDATKGVGQKNSDEQGRAVLYLHEERLRKALVQATKEDGYGRNGQGQYNITRKLLTVLEERGCLCQDPQGTKYAPSRAVFKVEYYVKEKRAKKNAAQRNEGVDEGNDLKGQKKIATWPVTIIVYADLLFPELRALDDYVSTPLVIGPHYGSRSGRQPGDSAAFDKIGPTDSQFNPNSEDASKIQPGTKESKRNRWRALNKAVAETSIKPAESS